MIRSNFGSDDDEFRAYSFSLVESDVAIWEYEVSVQTLEIWLRSSFMCVCVVNADMTLSGKDQNFVQAQDLATMYNHIDVFDWCRCDGVSPSVMVLMPDGLSKDRFKYAGEGLPYSKADVVIFSQTQISIGIDVGIRKDELFVQALDLVCQSRCSDQTRAVITVLIFLANVLTILKLGIFSGGEGDFIYYLSSKRLLNVMYALGSFVSSGRHNQTYCGIGDAIWKDEVAGKSPRSGCDPQFWY
ncbi:unnamed protein product [Cochlearia groenlandica]